MTQYEDIILERRGEIAQITLNRPHAANALTSRLMEEVIAATDELRNDDSVHAVIVTGAGDRHFCGGADLREAGDAVRGAPVPVPARLPFDEIERLPQPVIAAINGAAMGGGCELALASDFRLIAEGAQIGLTEIAFGGLPGGGGTQRLPRLVGPGRAKSMIMLGQKLSAATALEIGLVHEVVPSDQLLPRAEALALELADLAPYAVTGAKRCINEGMSMPLAQALRLEQHVVLTMATPEERQAAIEKTMSRSATYKHIFTERS